MLVRRWGPLLTFVFERSSASGPWLEALERFRVRFIIRWINQFSLWQMQTGSRESPPLVGFPLASNSWASCCWRMPFCWSS